MTSLVARAPCPPNQPLRVVVLASGGGSNLQALLDAQTASFHVVGVICNVEGARALQRAATANVPHVVVSHRALSREAFDHLLVQQLRAWNAEVVVLAGFMRVITTTLLDAFPRLVINVHPALLPAFPGMHGARQALLAGVRITGCTVHIVDAGVDTGPVLAQAAVAIHIDDTEETLQQRIQQQEHRLLPAVIDALAIGTISVDDHGRVRCDVA
jgi:phosphoribosylglycinamide formyltransferase 1